MHDAEMKLLILGREGSNETVRYLAGKHTRRTKNSTIKMCANIL